ncbi:MAG: type II toxin-antitoxin system death-on-curing family toxin [Xenococcaceae cyanobacterium MO_188.B29]|nr:type II toxin-antitoxin system death-on-curing family toxin [Xenococcaceae cyanobacterium MO_188.B29]
MISPIWIEEAVVIAIHRRQLAEHGGSDGIRDKGLLESALFRPKNQLAYGNPTIFDLAAAYGYGITKNHPFIDGNKRTSYVVTRTFLKLNGYDIQALAIEKYQLWMGLSDSQINETQLAKWIKEKSIKVK